MDDYFQFQLPSTTRQRTNRTSWIGPCSPTTEGAAMSSSQTTYSDQTITSIHRWPQVSSQKHFFFLYSILVKGMFRWWAVKIRSLNFVDQSGFFYHRPLKKLKLKDKTQAKTQAKNSTSRSHLAQIRKTQEKNSSFGQISWGTPKYAIFITKYFQ